MKKITLAATVLAASCMMPALAHAETASMICTGPTGKDYRATYDGQFVVLKNATWSAKLTVVDRFGSVLITKVNKKGIHTNVSFADDVLLINYFKGTNSTAYQQDRCREDDGRIEAAPAPSKKTDTVFAPVENACAIKWGSDYRMQKYCREQQYEAILEMPDMKTVSPVQRQIIGECYNKWTDAISTDFRMVKYCYDQQYAAFNAL